MSTFVVPKWRTLFQVALPALFMAGLLNRGVTYDSLQAMTSRWPEVCLFHRFTGLLCPGCGMTRSLISFFSYNLGLSWNYHPLGPVLGFMLMGLWLVSFWPRRWEHFLKIFVKTTERYAITWIFLLIVWSVYRNLAMT